MDIPLGYLPQGECKDSSKLVCKLQKSLYGLKQAPRQWNLKFTKCLLQEGFTQSKSNYSLFTKYTQLGFIGVLVYIGDIIIVSKSKQLIEQFKKSLSSHFILRDLGKLQYFFGLKIAKSSQGISITQRKFVLEMLEEFGVLGAKPSSVPMKVNTKLKHEDNDLLNDPSIYKQLIGKLMYIVLTRPDIAYGVHVLS